MVKLDDQKHIITDLYQQTSMEGFYACGDATHLEHKQIIIAASQGAIAALEASKFIQRRKRGKLMERIITGDAISQIKDFFGRHDKSLFMLYYLLIKRRLQRLQNKFY